MYNSTGGGIAYVTGAADVAEGEEEAGDGSSELPTGSPCPDGCFSQGRVWGLWQLL